MSLENSVYYFCNAVYFKSLRLHYKSKDLFIVTNIFLGSEEFLIELIVLYCKLLLETGNLPKVVAILQAVTEFYIFIPELDLKNFNPKNLFEKFW